MGSGFMGLGFLGARWLFCFFLPKLGPGLSSLVWLAYRVLKGRGFKGGR